MLDYELACSISHEAFQIEYPIFHSKSFNHPTLLYCGLTKPAKSHETHELLASQVVTKMLCQPSCPSCHERVSVATVTGCNRIDWPRSRYRQRSRVRGWFVLLT